MTDEVPATSDIDPQDLVDLLEVLLLGERPTLTGPEVSAAVGGERETSQARWRSLGFIQVPDEVPAFTPADVHALELIQRMRDLGVANDENEAALIRTFGRAFARLADFQVQLFQDALDFGHFDLGEYAAFLEKLGPDLDEVVLYVWRRHLFSAVARAALAGSNAAGTSMGVGFADIVGYTRQSRRLSPDALAGFIETFDARSQEIIAARGGRIIKTIGDEVMFVADTAANTALIALELTELAQDDPEFPQLRVGLAFGSVVARVGDVYGPTVNIASRLTSVARPDSVVVDRGIADALEDHPEFRLRRIRRVAVKGYRHLEAFVLLRPRDESDENADDS